MENPLLLFDLKTNQFPEKIPLVLRTPHGISRERGKYLGGLVDIEELPEYLTLTDIASLSHVKDGINPHAIVSVLIKKILRMEIHPKNLQIKSTEMELFNRIHLPFERKEIPFEFKMGTITDDGNTMIIAPSDVVPELITIAVKDFILFWRAQGKRELSWFSSILPRTDEQPNKNEIPKHDWRNDHTLLKKDKQERAILECIKMKGFNPLAVPDGEKGTIELLCKAEFPELFIGDSSFNNTWKIGVRSSPPKWRMQSHASYAKKGKA